MNTPKVLHLDHTVAPGGAEIALARLCKYARQWTPTVALPSGASGVEEDVFTVSRQQGTKVIEMGPAQESGATSSGPWKSLLFFAGVLRQASAVRTSSTFAKIDVVHTNTSRAGLYGSMACWVSNKPLVVHLRDMVTSESFGRIGELLFRTVVLSRADAVISNSYATLDSARPSIPKNTLVEVIPSPTGITHEHTPAPVEETVRRVGMVARIDPWKGQDILIKAFASVFAGTTVRLLLAGSPAFGHEEYLQKLIHLTKELNVYQQVDFLGQVGDVEGLLGTLDICVQASVRPEPLGQNVLQYLACGRPTIAAAAGGPQEWVEHGENGLLFEPGNINALADVLRDLYTDRQLRQKLSDNAPRLKRILNDQQISDLHGHVFRRVAESGHRRRRGIVRWSLPQDRLNFGKARLSCPTP